MIIISFNDISFVSFQIKNEKKYENFNFRGIFKIKIKRAYNTHFEERKGAPCISILKFVPK